MDIKHTTNGDAVRFDNFNNHHYHHHHHYLCLDDVGIDGVIAGNYVSLNHLMMMMMKMVMKKMKMRMKKMVVMMMV